MPEPFRAGVYPQKEWYPPFVLSMGYKEEGKPRGLGHIGSQNTIQHADMHDPLFQGAVVFSGF